MAGERSSEGDLVRRLQRGDERAFASIFEEHRRGLFVYVVSMTRNRTATEDILQDTFLSLARHARTLDPDRGVRAWLYRVARNAALDHLRRTRREPALEADTIAHLAGMTEPSANPFTGSLREDDLQRLMVLVAELPDAKREALSLRFFADLPFKDIAAVTQRPLGTVLWQVQDALKDLRQRFHHHTDI